MLLAGARLALESPDFRVGLLRCVSRGKRAGEARISVRTNTRTRHCRLTVCRELKLTNFGKPSLRGPGTPLYVLEALNSFRV
jgi:hypothetical protein